MALSRVKAITLTDSLTKSSWLNSTLEIWQNGSHCDCANQHNNYEYACVNNFEQEVHRYEWKHILR